MSERLKLFVVADDLTGANDTSVSFAEVGYRTLLTMDLGAVSPGMLPEVMAVTTDSRPSGAIAQGMTARAVDSAVSLGMEWLYLKVDSTMRGSVQHQVAGALRAWQQVHSDAKAVICPAYPAMGRVVSEGILRVDGVEVDQTASGRDAVCPVLTSRMAELLPESVVLPNPGDAEQLAAFIAQAGAAQVVVDATTQSELTVIAEAIHRLGPSAIPVGSAGLSQELARFLPVPKGEARDDPLPIRRRSLVVVSSIHETSQRQVDAYIGSEAGSRAIVFSPHPAQLLVSSAFPALRDQLRSLVASGDGNVIIRANPAKVSGTTDREQLARRFAGQLSGLASDCLSQERFDALVLVGGDGAAATLSAIGAEDLSIIKAVAEGVPVGTVQGGDFAGIVVVTKSGGFGEENLLLEIMARLEGDRDEEEN